MLLNYISTAFLAKLRKFTGNRKLLLEINSHAFN